MIHVLYSPSLDVFAPVTEQQFETVRLRIDP